MVAAIRELVQLLRDELNTRKSPSTMLGWSVFTIPTDTGLVVTGADHLSFPAYDPSTPGHMAGLQTTGLILASDTPTPANGFGGTAPFTFTNALAGANSMIGSADHLSFPVYDPSTLGHIAGLQTTGLILTSDAPTATKGFGGTAPFTVTSTLAGTNSIIGSPDHLSFPVYDPSALGHSTDSQVKWDSISVTFTRTNSIIGGADHLSSPLYDATALDHIAGLQAAGLILNGTPAATNGSGALTSANFASAGQIITGADHLSSLPVYDPATLSDFSGLPTAGLIFTSGTPTAEGFAGTAPFAFTNTLAGTSQVITGTDPLSLSKGISDLTASGRIITGWFITSIAAGPR